MNFLEIDTTRKCMNTDFRNGIGYVYTLKVSATRKGCYFCQRIGKCYITQIDTSRKRLVFFNGWWDCDLCKALAIRKCGIADYFNRFGKTDAAKLGAALKCDRTYFYNGIGNRDITEIGTTVKCEVGDFR